MEMWITIIFLHQMQKSSDHHLREKVDSPRMAATALLAVQSLLSKPMQTGGNSRRNSSSGTSHHYPREDQDKKNPPMKKRTGWCTFFWLSRSLCYFYGFALAVNMAVQVWSVQIQSRAQLFEGQLVLNPGLNLTQVSFSCVQKLFLG